ncbi:MAG: acetate--CoA ligase family protein [Bacillota bacterium]
MSNCRAQALKTQLSEAEAKAMLVKAGIPVLPYRVVRDAEKAVEAAEKMGYPVVLKVHSPDVVHKTDVGGVRLNLRDAGEVRAAFYSVLETVRQKCPGVDIEEVIVSPFLTGGVEVITGVTRDPQFGPVLMFGLGGVFVEVLKDVSFRVLPIGPPDAMDMIRSVKGYPVIAGTRGRGPLDLESLRSMLCAVSRMVETHPEIEELDMNPVFLFGTGLMVVDARMLVSGARPGSRDQ